MDEPGHVQVEQMIFNLGQDFADALASMPREHTRHRILKLLDEAIRRDVHFIARHPTTLFQCLWNTCWWYDCPEAAGHYESVVGPWENPGEKLHQILQDCRAAKEGEFPGFVWLRSLRPPPVHLGTGQILSLNVESQGVSCVAFSPAGHRIACGSYETIQVWDSHTGERLWRIAGLAGGVDSVAYSPDGKRFACASSQGEIVRVCDAETGQELHRVPFQTNVCSLVFSPDSQAIVVGCEDHTVRICDVETGAELKCFSGHTERVACVAISPDGKRVVSGSWDDSVRAWSVESGREEYCFYSMCHSIAYGLDSGWFATGSVNRVAIWDARNGKLIRELSRETAHGVSWCFGDQTLVSSSLENVQLWDVQTGRELRCFSGHEGQLQCVAASPRDERIVTGSSNGTATIWDPSIGESFRPLASKTGYPASLAYSPAGDRIVIGSWDGTVRVWNSETDRELLCLTGHTEKVNSVCYSPDGKLIASASGQEYAPEDATVRIWDAESGRLVRCLAGHHAKVHCVAFSADGLRVASSSGDFHGVDATIRVWSIETGEELLCLAGHEHEVGCVAFSPDGSQIVSGSQDGTVRLWDAASGKELRKLPGPFQLCVNSVAFSPDGGQVLTTDNQICAWDAESGEFVHALQIGQYDIIAVAHGPMRFAFLLCPRLIASTLDDAVSGDSVAKFPTELGYVATHPDGRAWIATNGNHVYMLRLEGQPVRKLASQKWYVKRDPTSRMQGPISSQDLKELVRGFLITRLSEVSQDGITWHRASKLRGIQWPEGS